eukprot:TRINITY_DN39839_c0_g1_i1.p1 TRINITY_DN39839_c0_g1~~TRINITY_DN39839_c0_g1_i1.p1  ORF type:complete len:829 (-),score=57.79 TRINITY_DN39839_c0_g1_i1:75-2561(-)
MTYHSDGAVPAAPPDDEDYVGNCLLTLLVDISVFLSCAIITFVLKQRRDNARRLERQRREVQNSDDEAEEPQVADQPRVRLKVTAKNYLVFLKTSRNTFLALTLLSLPAVLLPFRGSVWTSPYPPVSMSYWSGVDSKQALANCRSQPPNLSSCERRLSTSSFAVGLKFGTTLLNGIVVIAFAFKYLQQVTSRQFSRIQRHSVWLTGLPVRDKEDGVHFELPVDEFRRVGHDLRRELAKWIVLRWEQEFHTDALTEDEVTNSILEVYVAHAQDSDTHLAGHAFAVLSKEVYVMLLLGGQPSILPSWCHRRKRALFKFGKPPWSAVTLKCQLAPPPSDIKWANLGTPDHWIVGKILQSLLIFFVVAFYIPDTSALLNPAINHLQETGFGKLMPLVLWKGLHHFAEQLPSYLMLFVNSMALPPLIEIISAAHGPHLRSISQTLQFDLNLSILILSALVVPLLNVVDDDGAPISIFEDLQRIFRSVHTLNPFVILEYIRTLDIRWPKGLLLKYLLNAALLSNGLQLLRLGPTVLLWISGGRVPSNRTPFPWGYWYAWSMSVMYIALTISVSVPVAIPVAAIFFIATHAVHRDSLRDDIYDTFEMDNLIETRIAVSMIQSVAFFWGVSAFFYYNHPETIMEDIPASVSVNIPTFHTVAGVPEFAIPITKDDTIRTLFSGAFLASAVLSWLQVQFGYRWLDVLHSRGARDSVLAFLFTLTLVLVCGAFLCRPKVIVSTYEQPVSPSWVFVLVLSCCSLFARVLSEVTFTLSKRRVPFAVEARQNPELFRTYTRDDLVMDLQVFRREQRLTLSGLVERGDWYRPPDRLATIQLSP